MYFILLRRLGNIDKSSKKEANFYKVYFFEKADKIWHCVLNYLCLQSSFAITNLRSRKEKSTLLKQQIPRRLQTHHIHDLHEAESEVDSEWLGIIGNRSLQRVVIFQQLLVKLPLELSLQGLFGDRNK